LRGGEKGPNYYPESIEGAAGLLLKAGLDPVIFVDYSHDNSGKSPKRQEQVIRRIMGPEIAGDEAIVGLMLESNLEEGSEMRYGVSVTDECLGWHTAEQLLCDAYTTS